MDNTGIEKSRIFISQMVSLVFVCHFIRNSGTTSFPRSSNLQTVVFQPASRIIYIFPNLQFTSEMFVHFESIPVSMSVKMQRQCRVVCFWVFFLQMGYPHHRMEFERALVRGPLKRGRTPSRMPPVLERDTTLLLTILVNLDFLT